MKQRTWWKCHPGARATVRFLAWYIITVLWHFYNGTGVIFSILQIMTFLKVLTIYPSYMNGKRARSSPMFYIWVMREELGTEERSTEQDSRGPDERGVWTNEP